MSLIRLMEKRAENLAMLYQGAITGAVRIQGRRQQVGSALALRQRMKDVLAEIDREALRRGYTREQTSHSNFAFVAFLDEVILSSDDPCRDDWAKKPLQEDLFGVSTAGEQFFTRLDTLLNYPDSAQLIDVLEVYALCLLLGFQGRYIIGGRAELAHYTDRLEQRIEKSRGVRGELSPNGLLPAESIQASQPDPLVRRMKFFATGTTALAVLCFVVFAFHLFLRSADVERLLLRAVVP
ncbi:MAG TPA: DotU family type IV/VI secretion system protein [Bryobacteraceae bacterium]|nr:DotU family type IV/VI secretion system protein [Bryobacteraceae bacterium]